MTRRLLTLSGLFLWGWIVSCRPSPGVTPERILTQNADYLLQQGNYYWERRSNPQDAKLATFFLAKAHDLKPKDMDLAVLLSRAYHFEGHFLEQDAARQDSLFLAGAATAAKFLMDSLGLPNHFADLTGDSLPPILDKLAMAPAPLVPALYWWAANLGRYLATKPVLVRLAKRDILETAMHRILALEPNYFHGGPYRFFGAFYALLPGVELDRSAGYFKQAIKENPYYLGTYTLRAQYYHTKAGNRDLFHDDLTFVIEADPTQLPDVTPENLFEQTLAKKLLEQEPYLFE
ncbi:MAG: TRAP transporter TatT component family protein [Fidelibacterota bacterium]